MLCALLAIAHGGGQLPLDLDRWNACQGKGKIAFWIVSETCNRLVVVPRCGSMKHYRLRQFEFKNGDHFFESALALDGRHVVVTHQHGLYEADDLGRVVCEDSGQPTRLITLRGRKVIVTKEADGPWIDGRTFQSAVDWNGQRLLTEEGGGSSRSISLFTKNLRFASMIWFEGEIVLDCIEFGQQGWSVDLANEHNQGVRRTIWVSNDANISFDHGVHWH